MRTPQELKAWLALLRRFWSAHLDALERRLDRNHDRMVESMGQKLDQARRTKRKICR
jgi:hypothetical protein